MSTLTVFGVEFKDHSWGRGYMKGYAHPTRPIFLESDDPKTWIAFYQVRETNGWGSSPEAAITDLKKTLEDCAHDYRTQAKYLDRLGA